jgi:hypothetical protein
VTILLYELVGRDPERPFSPHCWKVRLALRHMGLAFRTVPVPFTGVPAIEGGSAIVRFCGTAIPSSRTPSRSRNIWKRPTRTGRACSAGKAAAICRASSRAGRCARSIRPWGALRSSTFTTAWTPPTRIISARAGKRAPRPAAGSSGRGTGAADRPVPATARARLRALLEKQPFLGGPAPLFADYIVFGAFQ